MEPQPRRTKDIQSGPRSRRVIDRVLKATMSELTRAGYAGLTIDGVARIANVNRTTIYRRWPKKADLVAALLEPEIGRMEVLPEGDDLRTSLKIRIKQLAHNIALPEGQALARVLTAMDPELEALSASARQRARDALRTPLEQAAARGDLSSDADIEMMTHLLFYGTVHWVMAQGLTLSDADCDRLIAGVIALR